MHTNQYKYTIKKLIVTHLYCKYENHQPGFNLNKIFTPYHLVTLKLTYPYHPTLVEYPLFQTNTLLINR